MLWFGWIARTDTGSVAGGGLATRALGKELPEVEVLWLFEQGRSIMSVSSTRSWTRHTTRIGLTAAVSCGLLASSVVASPTSWLASSSAEAATRSCSTSTPIASRPQLRRGDTGSCVKVLQRALIAKGYSVGSAGADGSFGGGTELAVRRFQSAYVGLRVDGLAGPATWRTLANGGTKYSISSGPNRTSKVVLSFDDCPASAAAFRTVADGAQKAGVALVLFPTGNCISQGRISPSYARSRGHYVFNHSVSHPQLTKLSLASVRTQLRAPGVVTTYGRPPYGAYNTTVLNGYAWQGMRPWTWTLDTRDWEGKSQSSVVSYVVSNSRAGSTVLMHMQWKAFNTTAINQMKAGLAKRGLSVCANRGATAVSPSSVNC